MVSLLERALPNLRLTSAHYQMVASRPGGGAVVSFLSRAQGSFTGELCLGETVVQGTDERVRTNVDSDMGGTDENNGGRRCVCKCPAARPTTDPPTSHTLQYKGDVELNLVAFDAEGLLQAYSTGIVVPDDAVAAVLSPEALQALGEGGHTAGEGEEDEEMVDLRRRLESQTQKLSATPEGTNAWEKVGVGGRMVVPYPAFWLTGCLIIIVV